MRKFLPEFAMLFVLAIWFLFAVIANAGPLQNAREHRALSLAQRLGKVEHRMVRHDVRAASRVLVVSRVTGAGCGCAAPAAKTVPSKK